jgi:hypothetical protein
MMLNFIQLLKFGFELKKNISKHETISGEFINLLQTDVNFPDKNRIQKYAIYIPAFITFAYSKLNYTPFSNAEIQAITALGALTALFDDLFDDYNYTDEYILNLIASPADNELNKPEIQLLLMLYGIFDKNTVHGQSAHKLITAITKSQINSRKQKSENLSIDELKQITSEKGGFAMQLYRRAFQTQISPGEDELFFAIGALGQLENDIFDVYNDSHSGIKTLANSELSIGELETYYQYLVNNVFEKLQKSGFTNYQKKEFGQIINLISARAKVALNQYKSLLKKDENTSQLSKFTRKELICDMEKPLNLLKLLIYTVGWRKN